jgi:hypothetical protein
MKSGACNHLTDSSVGWFISGGLLISLCQQGIFIYEPIRKCRHDVGVWQECRMLGCTAA